MSEKQRLFVDMDGTLATFKPIQKLETLYEKNYFLNLEPQMNVINAVQTILSSHPDIEVYILSAVLTDSEFALEEKNAWLDQYLPEIDPQHRIFPPCGRDKKEFLPDSIKENDFLLDDYTNNLTLWEPPARGIKLLNDINHTKGTWSNDRISFSRPGEDLAKHIVDIMQKDLHVTDLSPRQEMFFEKLAYYENKGFVFPFKEEYHEKYLRNLCNGLSKYEEKGFDDRSIVFLAQQEAKYVNLDEIGLTPNLYFAEIESLVLEHMGVFDFRYLLANDIVIVDTETTGLSAEDEIIELGIIDKDGNVLYNSLFCPEKPLDEVAQQIHGLTMKDLENKPNISSEWPVIQNLLKGKTIVYYNRPFDESMLQQSLAKHGVDPAEVKETLKNSACAMQSYTTYKDHYKSTKLVDALKECGIDKTQDHRAVSDCLDTLALMKHCAAQELLHFKEQVKELQKPRIQDRFLSAKEESEKRNAGKDSKNKNEREGI